MTTVQSTQSADIIAALNAKRTPAQSKVSETQDRFLTLLVTQMQNQDPLNPMDNAQVTSQMAQLSTVSGIDKLNDTLKALSDSFIGGQTMQAANMIGHGVLTEGKDLTLENGGAIAGFELPQAVEQLNINITNQAGVLVRTLNLGEFKGGIHNWAWDGKDNAGNAAAADQNYKFEISAKQGGQTVDATALQFGVVNSVTQGKQGVSLSVGTQNDINMSQVRRIL